MQSAVFVIDASGRIWVSHFMAAPSRSHPQVAGVLVVYGYA